MKKNSKNDEILKGSFHESALSSFHIAPNEVNPEAFNSPKKNKNQEQQLEYSSSPPIFQFENRESFQNVISISVSGSIKTFKSTNLMKGDKKGWIFLVCGSICFSVGALLVKKVEIDQISVLELMLYRSLFVMLILFVFDKLNRVTEKFHIRPSIINQERNFANGNELLLAQTKNLEENELRDEAQSPKDTKIISSIEANAITYVEHREKKFVQIFALLNSVIVFAYFYGIQQLPLFEAISLQNCSQLFTGALSCLDLAKNNIKMTKYQLISGVLLLLGIYFIAKNASFLPIAACLFLGSCVQAGVQVVIKKHPTNTQPMTLLFYSSLIQLLLAPSIILLFRKFHSLSRENATLILFMAFLQIIGTKCLQKSFLSFSHGPRFNLYAQLSILFSIFLGNSFLSDSIHFGPLLGALLIIASSVVQFLKISN